MTEDALKNCILKLAEPIVHALKLLVWGVEILRANRTVIRLYVDIPYSTLAVDSGLSDDDALGGFRSPAIDQCEEISRHLALVLDVENCIDGAYVLEVSTPGFSRIFFTLDQMRPYVGDLLEIKLHSPVTPISLAKGRQTPDLSPRRQWRGKLVDVTDSAFFIESVIISADGEVSSEFLQPFHISWSDVFKASRLYVFKRPAKPGKNKEKNR